MKNPWQMTREEWFREIDLTKINFTGTGGDSKYGMGRCTKEGSFNTGFQRRSFLRYGIKDRFIEGMQIPADHIDVVKKALSEGKRVPRNVLIDYPGIERSLLT